MGDPTMEGLQLLAAQLQAGGQWPGAIKCCEAVLQAGGQLPQAEATTRLWMARLLLRHTHNVHEARASLERALLVLGQLKSSVALRLEVLDALATAQRLQQQPRQQRATHARALEVCEQAAGGPHTAAAAAWLPRLHLAVAELDAAAGEAAAARGHVCAAAQAAQRQGHTQAQAAAMLFELQLLLAEGAVEAFEAAHTATAAWLAAAQAPPPLAAQLQLHCAALHALFLLRRGRTSELAPSSVDAAQQQGHSPTPKAALLQQLLHAAQSGAEPWQHAWLEPAEAAALVALLESCMARPSGQLAQAVAAARRGASALEPLLQAAGVSMSAGEAGLSLHGRAAARVPLTLAALLTESAAAALMTRCHLAEARGHILTVLTAVRGFPTLLAPLRASASALAGAYAVSVDELSLAAQHFHSAAEAAPDAATRRMAIIQAAAAEAASGDAAAVSSAVGRLTGEGLYSKPPESQPNQERAAGQLAAARLQLAAGQPGGKLLLTRGLKVAHNAMTNHQLVSQILNALAPVQRGTDASGASNMLTSSYTLAKNQGDLPSQIEALFHLDPVLIREEHGVDKVAKNRARIARYQEELRGRIAAAAADVEQHTAVLNWRL